MKKLICTVCCLCLVALLCTSCSLFDKPLGLEKYVDGMSYEDKSDYAFTPSTLTEINLPEKSTYLSHLDHLFVFGNSTEKTKMVYNAKTNKIILEYDNADIDDIYCFGAGEFTYVAVVHKYEDAQRKTSIYTDSGSFIDERNGRISLSDIDSSRYHDLFFFGGVIYRTVDRSATVVVDNPFFGEIPYIEVQTESYYYDVDDEYFAVYDKSLNEVFYKQLTYVEDKTTTNVTVLSDNTVLLQKIDILPETDEKYDAIYYGDKINLTSVIVNVETGKEKEVDLDYLVVDVAYCADYTDYHRYSYVKYSYDKIENLVFVVLMDEFGIINDDTPDNLAIIDSKTGKIDRMVFDDDDNCIYVQPVGNGNYIKYSPSESLYLLDENFEIVGKIDGDYVEDSNYKYLISDSALYDYDLNEVFNYSEKNYKVHAVLKDSVIFEDESYVYYLYKDGKETKIPAESIDANGGFYIGKDNGNYKVYTSAGELVGSRITATSCQVIKYDGGCILVFKLPYATDYVYYNLTK